MMHPTQGALAARGSSAPQADAHTVGRQGAAWHERGAPDGVTVSAALPCVDAGYRGATLVRPALERQRAGIAAGRVDRLSVPWPARRARQSAYHVWLVEACRRAGGEVLVLPRAWGQRPDDALLLPGQGLRAEYERATISARHRRGKRHAAHVGAGPVLRGAPSGSRAGPQDEGSGQAR